jgi:hypothetical protein
MPGKIRISGGAMTRSEIRDIGRLMLATACVLVAACGGKEDKPLTPEQQDAIARAAGQPSSVKSQSSSALFDRLVGTAAPGPGSRAEALVQRAMVPVYESPYKEPRPNKESPLYREFPAPDPNAAPTPLTKPFPARVRFEDVDWLAALPAPSDEVPGVRLGWYLNSVVGALEAAINLNRPLVVVIGERSCDECVRLAKALRCAAVERFAGDAVFAYSFPSRDLSAVSIAGALKVDAYPTVTVLEPESRMLIERARINGRFDATTLGNHLEEILWRVKPRSYAEFEPGAEVSPPPAPRAARPATAQEAEAAAKQRGLVHGPPAPVCR